MLFGTNQAPPDAGTSQPGTLPRHVIEAAGIGDGPKALSAVLQPVAPDADGEAYEPDRRVVHDSAPRGGA